MSTTYLNTKSRGITKTIAESLNKMVRDSEFREFIKEQVVEYRKDGMDVFKSPRPGDDRNNE
jgi:archaeosine-15-forming tRNA-guanine transglycosylase